MSSTPFRKHDDDSLKLAYGAFGVGVFAAVVGATHLNTAPQLGHPGGACLLVAVILVVAAGATIAMLLKRRRTARRLSAYEDTRLSPGQLSTKHDRGVTLGRHLFDTDADKIPEGEKARFAWPEGRTIGPVNDSGSDPTTMVGIYQAADPMPLYGQLHEGNRPFLVIFGLGVLAMAVCTLALA